VGGAVGRQLGSGNQPKREWAATRSGTSRDEAARARRDATDPGGMVGFYFGGRSSRAKRQALMCKGGTGPQTD
jgi:hypothetical protein